MVSAKKYLIGMVSILLISLVGMTTYLVAEYVPNSRDTKEAPESIIHTIDKPEDMVQLHSNDRFEFLFRDERDVLAAYDKTNGFIFMSGMDETLSGKIEDQCETLIEEGSYTEDDLEETCRPIEDLSTSARLYVNSFLTVNYLDDVSGRSRRLYSADPDYDSTMSQISASGDHWVLDVDFSDYGITLRVHFHFDDEGMDIEIREDELEIDEPEKLLSIDIAPFMGAQGGYSIPFDEESLSYERDQSVRNPINPGYSFVPDGPGALIRFEDTDINVNDYVARVYGPDITSAYSNLIDEPDYVNPKQATTPVFGMSYGDGTEAAFVAYATSGDEYMEIVSTPLSSTLGYVQTYARFIYSEVFRQVYNAQGDGYNRFPGDRNHFDMNLRYEFLSGDGSTNRRSADYVGMAHAYRDYLIKQQLLEIQTGQTDAMPIRIDFLMADSKQGVFGYEERVTSTSDDVRLMLSELYEENIRNVVSGLIGWQNGGVTLSSPKDSDFSNVIGSKRDFMDLIADMDAMDYDVSFLQDYTVINKDMITLRNNIVKHRNGRYVEIHLQNYQTIETEYYLKPGRSLDFLEDHNDLFLDMGLSSMTIKGVVSNLYGDTFEDMTRVDARQAITDAIADVHQTMTINAVQPNIYLMTYVDRYLDMPTFTTQYVLETDTVPFLQMVLRGSAEMYASYANFSFSSTSDMLRMIDYNVFPSFVLTHEPSYTLANTNSNRYISTQYRDYKDKIINIYQAMDDAFSHVSAETWLSRSVLENGVVLNQYSNDKIIIINYTSDDYVYQGQTVDALSYLCLD